MPSPAGVLFPQVVESPAREFIAAQVKASGAARLAVPAAGRFAAAAAAVPVLGAGNVTCYDAGLIPALLGCLATGTPLAGLGLTVPGLAGIQLFVTGGRDEYDEAAGIILAIRYLAMRRDTAYMAEQAKAVRAAADGLRVWLAGQLRAQAEALAGISFQGLPLAEAAFDPNCDAVFADLRGLGTRTRRELTAAEQMFWDSPPDPFGPKDIPGLLEVLSGRDQLAICCVSGDKRIPDGWVRLAATETGGSTDYVIANRDPGAGRLVKTRRRAGAGETWPVYSEQEIRPDSEIAMVEVSRDVGLHYRDLFTHRLAGSTTSEKFYLCLVDGRVISSLGLHFRDQVIGKTGYASETFGISVTSQRYARLGKLMMRALTSRQMLAFLLHESPRMLQGNPPAGIATSSPTLHEEGKGSGRGVMQLVRREPRPGGGFNLRYEAPFRDDTWADVVRDWHARYAHICRPDWDGPRLDPPQPEVKKRKRGRGRSAVAGLQRGCAGSMGAVRAAQRHPGGSMSKDDDRPVLGPSDAPLSAPLQHQPISGDAVLTAHRPQIGGAADAVIGAPLSPPPGRDGLQLGVDSAGGYVVPKELDGRKPRRS